MEAPANLGSQAGDVQLQILSDHYKDSFAYQREYLKFRDRLFGFILLTVTVLLFQLYSPRDAEAAISETISEWLGIQGSIDISFLGSMTWFVLLGLTLRYYQTVVLTEGQYKYLHRLEDQISPLLGDIAFRREGRSYLAYYPPFGRWAHLLYQWVFPLLLVLIAAFKIIDEWNNSTQLTWTQASNYVFCAMLFVSTGLYLYRIHAAGNPLENTDENKGKT